MLRCRIFAIYYFYCGYHYSDREFGAARGYSMGIFAEVVDFVPPLVVIIPRSHGA